MLPPVAQLLVLWPGLASLWLRGRLRGLGQAAAFGAVLNAALVATFVWPGLMGPGAAAWIVPWAGWLLVLWFWIGGLQAGRRELRQWRLPPAADAQAEALFRQAQAEYLKGHWFEAEQALGQLLARRPGDVEGRLLLVSVLRQSRRRQDAERELALLSEQPAAAAWGWELLVERQRLARLAEESSGLTDSSDSTARQAA